MKDSEEYRQDILNKVNQDPICLDTDEDMWEKVLERISDEEPKQKHYYIWYASAAAAFLILMVWAGIRNTGNKATDPEMNAPGTIAGSKISSDTKTTGIETFPDSTSEAKEHSQEKKGSPDIDKLPAAETEKKVALASGKTILPYKLHDGSEVTLNSDADIMLTEVSEKDFQAELSGEAYFEVKPDKTRAFKVKFGESYLVVVGTRFNVRNLKGESSQQVAVTEGIVKVYPHGNGQGIAVKSGELLNIGSDGTTRLTNIDPRHYIAWKTGELSFNDTQLDEVAAALQRFYKIHVIVDNNIKKCTFTADLSKTPLEDALKIIEATTSLKIKRTTDNVHISGSACN